MLSSSNQGQCASRLLRRLRMNTAVVRMIQGMAMSVLLTHLFACFWFMTAKFNEFEPDTWVARADYVDRSPYDQYLKSMLWSTQTVITVGYGDSPAVTPGEQTISLFWMVFGVGFYSFIVGNYSSIISSNIQNQASMQFKIKSLAELAKKAQIPPDIQKKIKKFIENNFEALYNQNDEDHLLKMLPPSLRDEVLQNTHGETINKIKVFRELEDTEFIWKLVRSLRPIKLEKGDVLYKRGDHSEQVYFIMKGTIKLYTEDGYPYIKYTTGDAFGDSDTLLDCLRDGKAIAYTHTNLLVLDKIKFIRFSLAYQDDCFKFVINAKKKRDLHFKLKRDAEQKAFQAQALAMSKERTSEHQMDEQSITMMSSFKPSFIQSIKQRLGSFYQKKDTETTFHHSNSNSSKPNSILARARWNSQVHMITKRPYDELLPQKTQPFEILSGQEHRQLQSIHTNPAILIKQSEKLEEYKSDQLCNPNYRHKQQSFKIPQNQRLVMNINQRFESSHNLALPNLQQWRSMSPIPQQQLLQQQSIQPKISINSNLNSSANMNKRKSSPSKTFNYNSPIKTETPRIEDIEFPKRKKKKNLIEKILSTTFGKKKSKTLFKKFPYLSRLTHDQFDLANEFKHRRYNSLFLNDDKSQKEGLTTRSLYQTSKRLFGTMGSPKSKYYISKSPITEKHYYQASSESGEKILGLGIINSLKDKISLESQRYMSEESKTNSPKRFTIKRLSTASKNEKRKSSFNKKSVKENIELPEIEEVDDSIEKKNKCGTKDSSVQNQNKQQLYEESKEDEKIIVSENLTQIHIEQLDQSHSRNKPNNQESLLPHQNKTREVNTLITNENFRTISSLAPQPSQKNIIPRSSSVTEKEDKNQYVSLNSLRKISNDDQIQRNSNILAKEQNNKKIEEQRTFSEAVAKVYKSHKRQLSQVNNPRNKIIYKRIQSNPNNQVQNFSDLIMGMRALQTFEEQKRIDMQLFKNEPSSEGSGSQTNQKSRQQIIDHIKQKFKATLEGELKRMQSNPTKINTERQPQTQYLEVKSNKLSIRDREKGKSTTRNPSEEYKQILSMKSQEKSNQFKGDPTLINIVKLNTDMGFLALNVFEIFNLFDLAKKGCQTISETIQNTQAQNNLIEMRQENIEDKINLIQLQIAKIKSLKEESILNNPIKSMNY